MCFIPFSAFGFRRFISLYYPFTCYHSAYFTKGAFDLPLLLKVSTAFGLFIIALLALLTYWKSIGFSHYRYTVYLIFKLLSLFGCSDQPLLTFVISCFLASFTSSKHSRYFQGLLNRQSVFNSVPCWLSFSVSLGVII